MTSRERVLAAINHQEPDKVPVDMGATPSSGISAIAYSNLVRHIGKEGLPVLIYDVVQQLAQPDNQILDLFGIDVLDIWRTFNDQESDWKPTTLINGASAFYPEWFNPVKMPDGSFVTYDDDGRRILSKMPVGATFFDQAYFPYVDGYPDSYDGLDAEMNRIMWARDVHSPWDHAGEPDFWEKLHTFIHSCGSISLLMPDMIEAGIEIFNPVQTRTYNMAPEFLKKEFGKGCTFWGGGIETVGTLNNGTSQQIHDQVIERLEIFSRGGGYVFNTVHNILPDVPPQNIITMFDAVREFNNRQIR